MRGIHVPAYSKKKQLTSIHYRGNAMTAAIPAGYSLKHSMLGVEFRAYLDGLLETLS